MKTQNPVIKSGFTLFETVIAIGVLAVLLTGFMYVFGPAANGIRRAIDTQDADRMVSTVERELTTVRSTEKGQQTTGFEKAYEWIRDSAKVSSCVFVYQYRGDPSNQRADGTLSPVATALGSPGKDYVVQAMCRRLSDSLFFEDLKAVEGPIFLVKCIQLTSKGKGEELEASKSSEGQITSPDGEGGSGGNAEDYPSAVIAFAAEFYSIPTKSEDYFKSSAFNSRFQKSKPVFVRNLAVHR